MDMLRKHLFTAVLLAIAVACKTWIFSTLSVGIDARSFHDGLLHITLAKSILDGQWLGKLNNLTFAKGPFYPMFIAFSNRIGVPLITVQQLLYTAACIMAAFVMSAVAKKWKHRIFLISFVLLMFHPYAFDAYINLHINRTGIYHSLSLLTFSSFFLFLIGMHRKQIRSTYLFSLLGGMFLACAWMTREESIWLLIPISILYIYAGIISWKTHGLQQVMANALIAISAFWICLSPVLFLNKLYYGNMILTEYQHPSFIAAYGALTRVKPDTFIPYVPVSRDARRKISAVSPTFAQIEPYLEGTVGANWTQVTKENAPLPDNASDIGGGWFMWALRDAVQAAHHYTTLPDTIGVYANIAHEINRACDAQTIQCIARRDTYAPPWNTRYVPYIQKYASNLFNELFFMNHVYLKFSEWEDPKENYLLMQNVSLEQPHVFVDTDLGIQIIKTITVPYKLLLFPFFIMGIGLYIMTLIKQKAKLLQSVESAIIVTLGIGIVGLFTILVLLAGMSYPLAIISGYFAPIPPLIILLALLCMVTYLNFSPKKKS